MKHQTERQNPGHGRLVCVIKMWALFSGWWEVLRHVYKAEEKYLAEIDLKIWEKGENNRVWWGRWKSTGIKITMEGLSLQEILNESSGFCASVKILLLCTPWTQDTLSSFSFVYCLYLSSSSPIFILYPCLMSSMLDHVKMDHNWLLYEVFDVYW